MASFIVSTSRRRRATVVVVAVAARPLPPPEPHHTTTHRIATKRMWPMLRDLSARTRRPLPLIRYYTYVLRHGGFQWYSTLVRPPPIRPRTQFEIGAHVDKKKVIAQRLKSIMPRVGWLRGSRLFFFTKLFWKRFVWWLCFLTLSFSYSESRYKKVYVWIFHALDGSHSP